MLKIITCNGKCWNADEQLIGSCESNKVIYNLQSDTKKTGTFEKPNKNWRNKKKIDRNWTITTCLLRDSNPNYQCLKITSCRWRPPPRMRSFTAITHFKSSRSFVSPCVCCMLCRMRQSQKFPFFGVILYYQEWCNETNKKGIMIVKPFKCPTLENFCIKM